MTEVCDMTVNTVMCAVGWRTYMKIVRKGEVIIWCKHKCHAHCLQATNSNAVITTINHPMPKSAVAAARDEMNNALMFGFSIGFSMLFGMAFLTSSFSHFLIRERQTGAKHLQVVSGVGPFSFWLATFAWDLVNYMIPSLVLLVIFAAFQVLANGEIISQKLRLPIVNW